MSKHCAICGEEGHYSKDCPNIEKIKIGIQNDMSHLKSDGCDFCKMTNCVAGGSSFFKTIGKRIFVDFRADMEFNQIDCQFGVLGEDGFPVEDVFGDFAIDISYCPICGSRLKVTEFNGIPMTCINNKEYEDCLTLGKKYFVKDTKKGDVKFQMVVDDNGEHLQTAIERFK